MKAIIIGAVPAGLTAAYELFKRMDIASYIRENGNIVWILKTINYKGNRMDMRSYQEQTFSNEIPEKWLIHICLTSQLCWNYWLHIEKH